ncbi:MAG TPA: hypothetical protein VNZ45_02105 [Bacteroidia bacterium]|jgi:hypothetical protein|nr:hypothetical protein [Bacteroidia bacterium]
MRYKGGNKYKSSSLIKLLAFAAFVLCFATIHAQSGELYYKPSDQSKGPETKAQRKTEERQKALEKKSEKAQEEAKDQHMKHQTKAVRKRMKEDAHTADLNNEHKREFFLKRWFSKKKP